MTTGKRTVLYGRVSALMSSTATRPGSPTEARSVDDQLAELRRWAAREGHTVVAELRDDGISASRYGRGKSRPDWQRAMDLISTGQVDVLAVWAIARATRDRAVWSALIAACIEHGVLLAVDGKLHDPTDPDDGFMLDISAALAVHGSARISKDAKRSVQARAARGAPHGRVPDGYSIEYDTATGRPLRRIIDPVRGPLVREIVDRLLAGESAYAVAADFNDRGLTTKTGKPWLGGNIVKRVKTPSLAGLRTHRGQVLADVTAEWPPIVTPEEYHRLVALLTDPSRKSNREGPGVKWLGTGIYRCGVCDSPMRMISGYRPNGTRRVRYSCATKHCVMRAAELVDQVVGRWVVAYLSRADVLEALSPDDDQAVQAAAAEVARLRAKLADARAKVDRDEISLDDFAHFRSGWDRRLHEAERRARPRWVPDVAFDVAGPDAGPRWDDTPLAGKRTILRALFEVKVMSVGSGGGNTFDPSKIVVRRRPRR